MEGLFDKDPVMKPRDSKGRFATLERAYADKAIEENKKLRYYCDKYKRAWHASMERALMARGFDFGRPMVMQLDGYWWRHGTMTVKVVNEDGKIIRKEEDI